MKVEEVFLCTLPYVLVMLSVLFAIALMPCLVLALL